MSFKFQYGKSSCLCSYIDIAVMLLPVWIILAQIVVSRMVMDISISKYQYASKKKFTNFVYFAHVLTIDCENIKHRLPDPSQKSCYWKVSNLFSGAITKHCDTSP